MKDGLNFIERREEILLYLTVRKKTTRFELASEFGVSLDTIDRDITYNTKMQIFKRSELTGQINTLPEQIEELKSEKSMLLDELGCADDKDISKINDHIYDITEALAKMERHTDNCKDSIKNALQEFDELYMQTADMDIMELIEERLRIRPQVEQEAETELKAAYKDSFSRDTFKESMRKTDNDLHEDLHFERSSIIRKLKAYKQQQEQTYPKPKQHSYNDEEWEL